MFIIEKFILVFFIVKGKLMYFKFIIEIIVVWFLIFFLSFFKDFFFLIIEIY